MNGEESRKHKRPSDSQTPGPASEENCEGCMNPKSVAGSSAQRQLNGAKQIRPGCVKVWHSGSGTPRERETVANDPAGPV